MGATTLTTNPLALAYGAPPIPESDPPSGGIILKLRAWFSSHALRAYLSLARVGGGSAERARRQERGRSQSRVP